jgi:SAM-dependent methyltransferase
MSILDMGCGPGLYAEKFAEYGHRVTGIDFSESSIAYARSVAARNNSPNSFVCGNYLEMDFSNRFDLVIMIYLDFCVLKPQERKIVLQNVHRALRPGGSFVFDVVNGRNIQEKVLKPSWEVSGQGFWRDGPYLVLNNGFHYPEARVLANQHIVIDQSEEIRTYLFWSTCYESEDLEPILEDACFHNLRKHGNVLPGIDPWSGENVDFYIAGK